MAQVPCVGLYKPYTIPYLLGSVCHVFWAPQDLMDPMDMEILSKIFRCHLRFEKIESSSKI